MAEPTAAMWAAYRAATGTDPVLLGSFAFGDSPEMADSLAQLVRTGPKRATAGLELDFEADEPIPEPGQHEIVLDGAGNPVCVIRYTRVDIVPLNEVDEAFAWDEGEGDRSLAYWLDAHERFFRRRCAARGVEFRPDLRTVCQRFEVVWPHAATGVG